MAQLVVARYSATGRDWAVWCRDVVSMPVSMTACASESEAEAERDRLLAYVWECAACERRCCDHTKGV